MRVDEWWNEIDEMEGIDTIKYETMNFMNPDHIYTYRKAK